MTTHYDAYGRDMLADLILAIPMDEDVVITHHGATFDTRYHFPAVMRPDGGEIEPRLGRNGYNPTPEEHRKYQIDRRARISRSVRRCAKRDFE